MMADLKYHDYPTNDLTQPKAARPRTYEEVVAEAQRFKTSTLVNTINTLAKSKSDGSSTDYYKIPANATDLIDIIEHKNMNFAIGNIFKACYRLGEKDGNDHAYDLRKILFFAERELARIGAKR